MGSSHEFGSSYETGIHKIKKKEKQTKNNKSKKVKGSSVF